MAVESACMLSVNDNGYAHEESNLLLYDMIFMKEGNFFINIEELIKSLWVYFIDCGSREPVGITGRMRHTTMHLLHYYRRCHNGKESRRIY